MILLKNKCWHSTVNDKHPGSPKPNFMILLKNKCWHSTVNDKHPGSPKLWRITAIQTWALVKCLTRCLWTTFLCSRRLCDLNPNEINHTAAEITSNKSC